MTRRMSSFLAVGIALLWGTLLVAAQQPDEAGEGTPEAEAFEHYEQIRVVLASDQVEGIGEPAEALAPLAGRVAGNGAKAAAEQLASTKSLDDAREFFGALSASLVPKFLDAGLPGVYGFTCAMKKQPWAQRTKAVENPYFGKSMLTCGDPIEP